MPLAAPDRWFASDNAAGAHPRVLEALVAANSGHALAYGQDDWTRRATRAFCELFDRDVEVLFTFGGTGANVVALSCLLPPAHAVACSRWAHIAVDEAGAPERFLGAKLVLLDSVDGTVRADDVAGLSPLFGSQHHAPPGVLSLTNVTEMGAVWAPDALARTCRAARERGMSVHLDGARIANAAAALGGRTALREMVRDVDVLTFGGTKAGAVYGEAVVFLDPSRARHAANLRKQATQLPSKMRFVAAQYEALLADDLFIELGDRANRSASRLYDRLGGLDLLDMGAPPQANSMFPRLPAAAKTLLQEWSFFWDWDVSDRRVRWMTAWDTSEEDIQRFADGVRWVLDRGDY
ncbi:MAG: threonine aldolase [Actinobacteria bacterium]|nr:threonine aldolase [Actinomycetota bacterium]